MIICVCKVVSHRVIEAQVANGATCVKDIAKSTGACTQCGRCKSAVRECIEAAQARQERSGCAGGIVPVAA